MDIPSQGSFTPNPLDQYDSSQPCRAQRVMIVDDDTDDVEILEGVILDLHPTYTIHCCQEPKEMIGYLDALKDEELPTLIIITNKIHLSSGCEIVSEINKQVRTAAIPKIIYSGALSGTDIKACCGAGAVACLEKGNTVREVQERVCQMLSFCHTA